MVIYNTLNALKIFKYCLKIKYILQFRDCVKSYVNSIISINYIRYYMILFVYYIFNIYIIYICMSNIYVFY